MNSWRLREYKERSDEINKIASDFKVVGLERCGQTLENVAHSVLIKDFRSAERELRMFFVFFEQEYINNDAFRKECFHSVIEIVFFALVPDGRTEAKTRALVSIHPILLSLDKGLELHTKIESMFKQIDLDNDQRFLSYCLIYNIVVEGLYDESIRLLYALKKVRDNAELEVTLESIDNKSLHNIKNEGVLPEILFRGWENGHLRNAIAHARIDYVEEREVMHFIDVNSRNEITYNKFLPLKDFLYFAFMLYQIPVLFVYALKALRACDLIFSVSQLID